MSVKNWLKRRTAECIMVTGLAAAIGLYGATYSEVNKAYELLTSKAKTCMNLEFKLEKTDLYELNKENDWHKLTDFYGTNKGMSLNTYLAKLETYRNECKSPEVIKSIEAHKHCFKTAIGYMFLCTVALGCAGFGGVGSMKKLNNWLGKRKGKKKEG